MALRALSCVLVQPEMERRRSPLVSIPPFGRGFTRHRYDHQAIPSAWLRPRRARFRFARQDHCSSTMPIRLNFRLARRSGIITPSAAANFSRRRIRAELMLTQNLYRFSKLVIFAEAKQRFGSPLDVNIGSCAIAVVELPIAFIRNHRG